MIQHQNIFLPDGEEHFVEWMTKNGEIVDGRGSYQIRKLRAAMTHVKSFRTAVDIGGHVGLWSMHLAKKFRRVDAFEPVAAHRECFVANVPTAEEDAMQNVYLHPYALGDHEDNVFIRSNPISSGDSRVDGAGEIPMRTLDSFNLQEVDFIKIDTEGYELFAVRGAEETVKRCRPTMVVEQKGHGMKFHGFRKEEAAELLESWGMKRVANMSGDVILTWG